MTLFQKGTLLALIGCLSWGIAGRSHAATEPDTAFAAAQDSAKKTYRERVAPFVTTYCVECHGETKRKGGITFQYANKNPAGSAFSKIWKQSGVSVNGHDMPPEEAKKQPTDEERKTFTDWVAQMKYLSPKDPGPFVIRRLSKIEYGNTLHDLFGVPTDVVRELPDEVLGAGYLNSLSPLLMEQYLAITNDVLTRILAPDGAPPTAIQQRLFGDTPGSGTDLRAAARDVARTLATRAYRRPASEPEIDVLMQVFDLATKNGRAYPAAMRLVLKAVLVSPQFLFITPGAAPDPAQAIVPLDDHQLASRLSYLLWSTMPDPELAALADAGTLHDPAILAAQVRRLLGDPRSRALFDGFGAQWLGLGKLATKTFDAAKFPQMTAEMRLAMYDEARLLFENITRNNLSLMTFIDCDYTFLNGTLASIYGLEKSVTGPEMRQVKLTDANRGGILSMPGILATTSFPNRTSPVNRGVWVLEQLLGEHVPPAPPNVPTLEKQDQRSVANLTLRQRTELHRTNPACTSCHKTLDPIGFGLESFDAIGRWREQDDTGGAIDSSGELPGGNRFSSPRELKAILAKRTQDLCRNLTEKLLAYALCRQLEGYDEIIVERLAENIARDGYRMQTLITEIVTSYPFVHRRIQETLVTSHEK